MSQFHLVSPLSQFARKMVLTQSSTIHLILLHAVLSSVVNADCYYPKGNIARHDTPCHYVIGTGLTAHSACCMLGYDCLSNGICKLTRDTPDRLSPEYMRGSCTDETWKHIACPRFCLGENLDVLDAGQAMVKCENTTKDVYYCRNSGLRDCATTRGMLVFQGRVLSLSMKTERTMLMAVFHLGTASLIDDLTTSAPELWSTTSSATITLEGEAETQSTNRASASTTPSPSNDSPDKGAIIGGAVGGALAVLVFGGIVLFWVFSRLRKNHQKRMAGLEQSGDRQVMRVVELPVPSFGREISEPSPPQELPTSFNTKPET